jgi:hypothetical protein
MTWSRYSPRKVPISRSMNGCELPRDFWSRLMFPKMVPSYMEWNAKVIAEMQVLLDAI